MNIFDKIIDVICIEINKKDVQDKMKNSLIKPLMKQLVSSLFPYFIGAGIMYVILLIFLIIITFYLYKINMYNNNI